MNFKPGDVVLEVSSNKYYYIQDDLGPYWYATSKKPNSSNGIIEIKLILHNDNDFIRMPRFEEEVEDL